MATTNGACTRVHALTSSCLYPLGAVLLFIGGTTQAAAQDVTPVALAGPPSEQDRQTNPHTLMGEPEIVVTARKSSESIQDVPIAITALNSDELQESRVFDVKNLAELVPGMTVAGSGQRGYPVIRGITTRTPDAGADGAVGQYIDQIYQPRIANSLTGLLDLDRVEVLKGPQGTLFGRNTIAGAINYVTKRPGKDLDIYGMTGIGNRGLFEARASVSGPLSSAVSAGVAGLYRSSNGNFDVVNDQGRKIGDDGSKDYGGRLSVVWKPTGNLEFYGTAMYLRVRGAIVDQVDGNPAGVIAPALAGFYAPSTYVANYRDYKVALTDPGYSDRDMTQYSLRADWQLDSYLTLTSLTGYQRFNLDSKQDLDLEVQDLSTNHYAQKSRTISQEVRLAGSDDLLKWNIGGNYFYDNHDVRENTDITDVVPIPLLTGTDVKTTSWALFGQGYLTPIKNLTLTAGLRYSHDHRDYRKTQQFSPIAEDFDSALDPDWDTTPSWHDLSYTFAIDYHLRKGLMVYVSHSRGYRSGGVQGRAQTEAEAAQNYGPEIAKQYEIGLKSEFLDRRFYFNLAAYRIDYSDIQINQISYAGAFPADVIQNAAKARMEGVEIDGKFFVSPQFSLDFGYSYNNSRFLSYSSSSDIAASIDGLGYCPAFPSAYGCSESDYIFDSVPFEFAPRHTFNVAANFDHEFASMAALHLRVEYSWKDHHLLTVVPRGIFDLPRQVLDDNFIRQPAYGLLNGNIGFDFPGGKVSVSVWGRNLTGKRYAVLGSDPSIINDPGTYNNFTLGDRRTFGVSLTVRR